MKQKVTTKEKIIKSPGKQCPLCKDSLEENESYTCSCSYQICYDCYEDYKSKEGYCRHCKKDYPIRRGQKEETKSDKKIVKPSTLKTHDQSKQKPAKRTNYTDLAKVRIVKKNLVYVIGLAPQIANEETLQKFEYFGQYGKISKIVVNKSNIYNPNGPNGPSYSAYITYAGEKEASIAILAVEEHQIHERIIRASYGTTKYCSYFLKHQECPNIPECLYLHTFQRDKESFQKDDMTSNKNIFIDQQKLALKNIQKYVSDLAKLAKPTKEAEQSILPHPSKILKNFLKSDLLTYETIKIIEDNQEKQDDEPDNEEKLDKKPKIDDTPLIDQWAQDTWTDKKNGIRNENGEENVFNEPISDGGDDDYEEEDEEDSDSKNSPKSSSYKYQSQALQEDNDYPALNSEDHKQSNKKIQNQHDEFENYKSQNGQNNRSMSNLSHSYTNSDKKSSDSEKIINKNAKDLNNDFNKEILDNNNTNSYNNSIGQEDKKKDVLNHDKNTQELNNNTYNNNLLFPSYKPFDTMAEKKNYNFSASTSFLDFIQQPQIQKVQSETLNGYGPNPNNQQEPEVNKENEDSIYCSLFSSKRKPAVSSRFTFAKDEKEEGKDDNNINPIGTQNEYNGFGKLNDEKIIDAFSNSYMYPVSYQGYKQNSNIHAQQNKNTKLVEDKYNTGSFS